MGFGPIFCFCMYFGWNSLVFLYIKKPVGEDIAIKTHQTVVEMNPINDLSTTSKISLQENI